MEDPIPKSGMSSPLSRPVSSSGWLEVGQIEDGQAEKFEEGVGGGGLAVGEVDGAGDHPPIGVGQAAVGYGAVNEPVVALADLEQNPA